MIFLKIDSGIVFIYNLSSQHGGVANQRKITIMRKLSSNNGDGISFDKRLFQGYLRVQFESPTLRCIDGNKKNAKLTIQIESSGS